MKLEATNAKGEKIEYESVTKLERDSEGNLVAFIDIGSGAHRNEVISDGRVEYLG